MNQTETGRTSRQVAYASQTQNTPEEILKKMKNKQKENLRILLAIGGGYSILSGVVCILINYILGFVFMGALPLVCIIMLGVSRKTGWGIGYLILLIVTKLNVFIQGSTLLAAAIVLGIIVVFIILLKKNKDLQHEIDNLEGVISSEKYIVNEE